MTAFLFIHGINVRGKDLDVTLEAIRPALAGAVRGATLAACRWGDDLGATLHCGGSSIPDYDTARAVGDVPPWCVDQALWLLLYQDPKFELRLMAMREDAEEAGFAPGQLAQAERLRHNIATLEADPLVAARIGTLKWEDYLQDAVAALMQSDEFAACTDGAPRERLDVLPGVLARALCAAMSTQAAADGLPAIAKPARDALVEATQTALGGTARGIGASITAPVLGLAQRLATRHLQRKRGAISDQTVPVAGDVIRYQARGAAVRQRIADIIADTEGQVSIIAHSLGGIAAVDTLLLAPALRRKVKRLYTVGSQVGFFYENDALIGLPAREPLPPDFPGWTNFYDRSDLLSYLSVPLLGKAADDQEIVSGQPFPHAHSAYWQSPVLWDLIAQRHAA